MHNADNAARALRFVRALKHTKGKWAGVPFTVLPWQEQILSDVFGTVREDGYRQFQTAYVEIPKKNGKSELAAAIALYLLCADGEQGAEVYGAAADRQQASIVFDVAVDMVDQCKPLREKIRPILSQKRLVYLPTRSFYRVLSAEAFTKHGLNVHGVIFDELHAQPNRNLYDVLTKGSGDARMQPLFFLITTAGDDPDRTSIGWEVHEKARRLLEGTATDSTFYAAMYGLGEDEDWASEENWFKSNPSLGHTIRIETVRAAFEAAQDSPADERAFRQLRLNQWIRMSSTRWVGVDKWDATAGMVVPEDLVGRACYGGFDLSSKIDITAFVLVFPPDGSDDKWRILPWFWMPEENIQERERRDHVPYRDWVKRGLITATPGNIVDYAFVRKTIQDAAALYDIREIGFDPWGALQLSLDLADDGFAMAEVRQGPKSMSPPMKELEGLIVSQAIRHGGNPVLRWMFSNVEITSDENNNIRPTKKHSTGRIDGVVALINALARAIVHEDEGVPQVFAV